MDMREVKNMTKSGDALRINGPNIVHENIDGETVILNLDTGSYFSITDVAAYIWSCIEKGVPAPEIPPLIRGNYENVGPDAEQEIQSFISHLEQEGLVVRVTDASPAAQDWKTQIAPGNGKTAFNVPVLNKYSDMQDLLLLDPIHHVDETGWPSAGPKQ
jgi:hypothetical protein